MTIETVTNKANPSNFQLVFPKVPTEETARVSRELTLNIYGTIIPSLSLGTDELQFLGGKHVIADGSITFEPWSVNFLVDSQFKNWKILYKWCTYINNNKDKFGEVPGKYAVDATLQVTENFQADILEILFKGVWINSLNEIGLSYREGNQELECNASFSYDRYEIVESEDTIL